MSELDRAGSGSTLDNPGAQPSAGAMLRLAREASGLHIAALAVSLKVPVKKLEALESDRFDLLPDAVFVRALASSVCRTLKVDPAPILGKLPQTAAPRLAHASSGINAPFRAPSDGPGPSTWDQVSRPAVLAVLALLMGALVLIFLPDIRGQMSAASSVAETAIMPPPGTSPSDAPGSGRADAAWAPTVQGTLPGSGASAAGAPVSSVPAANTATLQAPVALASTASLSTPTVASPTLVITPGPAVAAPAAAADPAALAAAPAAGIVVFTAKGESWVEVTDAKGTVSLRKTLAPGEAAGASGALPLSVVVGRADSTQVQVRGKPFDLAPLSRDNVARFEVK